MDCDKKSDLKFWFGFFVGGIIVPSLYFLSELKKATEVKNSPKR